MEAGNAYAFYTLGVNYAAGEGVPQDMTKANELYLRGGELGCAEAFCNLGYSYYNGNGVEVDKKKAIHYWELAAMNGNVLARYNLGCEETDADSELRAFKHFILSARAGFRSSLGFVQIGFMDGIITKEEYANTLRAYQQRHDEMKSEDRDEAEAFNQRRRLRRR